MNEKELTGIVEEFNRLGSKQIGDITVIRIPDWKSVFIETIDGVGRSIMMAEYKVAGKTYFAGFSSRSQTVYVSNR